MRLVLPFTISAKVFWRMPYIPKLPDIASTAESFLSLLRAIM
jgi:hypothetical protein